MISTPPSDVTPPFAGGARLALAGTLVVADAEARVTCSLPGGVELRTEGGRSAADESFVATVTVLRGFSASAVASGCRARRLLAACQVQSGWRRSAKVPKSC